MNGEGTKETNSDAKAGISQAAKNLWTEITDLLHLRWADSGGIHRGSQRPPGHYGHAEEDNGSHTCLSHHCRGSDGMREPPAETLFLKIHSFEFKTKHCSYRRGRCHRPVPGHQCEIRLFTLTFRSGSCAYPPHAPVEIEAVLFISLEITQVLIFKNFFQVWTILMTSVVPFLFAKPHLRDRLHNC